VIFVTFLLKKVTKTYKRNRLLVSVSSEWSNHRTKGSRFDAVKFFLLSELT
jgi:hypothetical protein